MDAVRLDWDQKGRTYIYKGEMTKSPFHHGTWLKQVRNSVSVRMSGSSELHEALIREIWVGGGLLCVPDPARGVTMTLTSYGGGEDWAEPTDFTL